MLCQSQILRAGESLWGASCLMLLFAFCMGAVVPAFAQEGSWQFSASGGTALLRMDNANETLNETVERWNTSPSLSINVPVGPFDPITSATQYAGTLLYRLPDGMGLSISGRWWNKPVTNAYEDQTVLLELDRSLRAIQLDIGLVYFFPLLRHRIEPFAAVEIGAIWARALANTYHTKQTKVGSTLQMEVVYDTKAIYRKSRLTVGLSAGATFGLAGPLLLKAEAGYTLAKIGTMEGEVSRVDALITDQSVTDFDFSSLRLLVGMAYEF